MVGRVGLNNTCSVVIYDMYVVCKLYIVLFVFKTPHLFLVRIMYLFHTHSLCIDSVFYFVCMCDVHRFLLGPHVIVKEDATRTRDLSSFAKKGEENSPRPLQLQQQ